MATENDLFAAVGMHGRETRAEIAGIPEIREVWTFETSVIVVSLEISESPASHGWGETPVTRVRGHANLVRVTMTCQWMADLREARNRMGRETTQTGTG